MCYKSLHVTSHCMSPVIVCHQSLCVTSHCMSPVIVCHQSLHFQALSASKKVKAGKCKLSYIQGYLIFTVQSTLMIPGFSTSDSHDTRVLHQWCCDVSRETGQVHLHRLRSLYVAENHLLYLFKPNAKYAPCKEKVLAFQSDSKCWWNNQGTVFTPAQLIVS